MKNMKENTNKEQGNSVITIFKGIIISFLFTLVLLFIFSVLLTYTNIQEQTIGPVIIIVTTISILLGTSISMIHIKKNGILNGGIVGLVYIGIIYICSSSIETGFSINIYSLIMIIFSIISGMIGGIVGVNIKK
ncbi:MAG: TIGR04086 family membrane protein [Clostridia bacterium]|nr:TIGR04086 family membrane protein [Clostridia bacterium]